MWGHSRLLLIVMMCVVCASKGIDNSNYQIDEDQLRFFQDMLGMGQLFILVMHIPIYFPGMTWGPSDVMGHPLWSDSNDKNAEVEARLKWPKHASQSTVKFIEAVQESAKAEQLVAILTGHTHEAATVPVPCPHDSCKTPVKQFTTRANFGGGARLLIIRSLRGHSMQSAGLTGSNQGVSGLACALLSLGCVGVYVLCTRPRTAPHLPALEMPEVSDKDAVGGQQ